MFFILILLLFVCICFLCFKRKKSSDVIIHIAPNGNIIEFADFIVLYDFNETPNGFEEYNLYTFASFQNKIFGVLVLKKHEAHIDNEINDEYNGIVVNVKFLKLVIRDYKGTINHNDVSALNEPIILVLFGDAPEENNLRLVSVDDINVYYNSAVKTMYYKEISGYIIIRAQV
jgi:hypothetical protein